MADNQYDALLAESPEPAPEPAQQSPYDALLAAAPIPSAPAPSSSPANPYDALLQASPLSRSPDSGNSEDVSKFIKNGFNSPEEPLGGAVAPNRSIGESAKAFASDQMQPLGPAIPTASNETAGKIIENMPGATLALYGAAKMLFGNDAANRIASVPVKVATDTANFFQSPVGLATIGLGAAPRAVQTIAGSLFAANAIKQTPELVTDFANAKTPDEQRDIAVKLIENAGMATGGLLAHAHPDISDAGEIAARNPGIPENEIARAIKERDNARASNEDVKPEMLDGLVTARNQVRKELQNQPGNKVLGNTLATINNQLYNVEPSRITESEARVAQPPESPPPKAQGSQGTGTTPSSTTTITPEPSGQPAAPLETPTPKASSVVEQLNSLQDKLSELQAEHDWQIEEGVEPQYLSGLRKTIGDVSQQMEALKEQRYTLLLQATDAPHTSPEPTPTQPPVAGNIEPPSLKSDISPGSLGITPQMPPLLNKLTDMMSGVADHPAIKDVTTAFKGWLGGLAGKTFPKLTEIAREAGEKGARWISSRIAALPSARLFSDKVLEGTDVDPVKFGAALHEDNLRSIREGFKNAGEDEKAANVNTIIGGKGSPFKTEADYQKFLSEPEVRQAIDRHKALWDQVIDPMYKNAMKIDPDEVLPSRGLQTGARINLNPLREGEPAADKVFTVGRGNLLGTLQKKSPFGMQAKGTGEGYGMNYHDVMANTFGKQLEIANKNDFENELIKQGLAKVDQPGQQIEINGKQAQPFPYKRQTLITEGGQVVPQSRSFYVDPRIAKEYLIGSNASPSEFISNHGESFSKVIGKINSAALTGLTDATVHLSNLASALLTRPAGAGGVIADTLLSSLGRADVPVTLVRAIVKGFQDNKAQIKELSEIGAMRASHPGEPSPWYTPKGALQVPGRIIQWADKTARLSLDDAFQRMQKSGLVENTETNRREFVNQVGQYNKRAQGAFTRLARDTGLAPFVTAGKNFNALAARTATLNPGVKATSIPSALALRANVAAKWAGAVALVGSMNYLITGKVAGRTGIPIGNIDTGKNDANGRPLSIPVFPMIGLGRAMRVTGARGALEASKSGLTTQDALNSAARDIANTSLAPWIGPTAKFIGTSIGQPLGKDLPRPAPVVAHGENQFLSDLGHAVINSSPVIGSIYDANKVGGSLREALQRQLPRYLPQSGKPESMMAHYPEIVQKAQDAAFLNDTVGRARKLEPQARAEVIQDALSRISPENRAHAIQELRYRRITP